MPERIKLTEKLLCEAVPVVGRDYQIFDADVRSFAVCIDRVGAGEPSALAIAMPGGSAG